jgi:hypothetical protein
VKKLSKYGLFGFLLISLALLPMAASAISVGTELVMLADVSGSVDSTDFSIQSAGYAAAFRDPEIIQAIENVGGIAATLVYWSAGQAIGVGWTHVTDSTSSNAFADAIASAARPDGIGTETGMAKAMNYGTNLFLANSEFESDRWVMDVSGDGSESVDCNFNNPICSAVQNARDDALDAGVNTINALWIQDRTFFGDFPNDTDSINALEYGTNNVIGGSDYFQELVGDFDEFAVGVRGKILGDIKPPSVPEAATILLLGFGLTGIAGLRCRKFKK